MKYFANSILILSSIFCAVILLYTSDHYETHSLNPGALLVYYFFPSVFALSFLICLRLKPSQKINISLVILSSALSIYASEFALLINPYFEKTKEELAKDQGINWDIRTRKEVVKDLQRKKVSTYPSLVPSLLLTQQADGIYKSELTSHNAEILPLGGISNSTIVHCNEGGYYRIYESDEHGFPNPKGLWKTHSIDIAAVGDSFTQGVCVHADEEFVGLIRAQYPYVLNLGAGGNGPLTMLATIQEYVRQIKPKMVLYFYYENDLSRDLDREKMSPLLMQYMAHNFNQGLLQKQLEIDRLLKDYVGKHLFSPPPEEPKSVNSVFSYGSPVARFLRLNDLRDRLGLVYGEQIVPIKLFRQILLQAKTEVEGWGGKFWFVYLPADDANYRNPRVPDRLRERVLQLVKELDIPIIDMHPVFQKQPDPLDLWPFRRGGHYNEKGHRLVAEEVLQRMKGEGIRTRNTT